MASILLLNLLKTSYICSQYRPIDSIFNRYYWFSRITEPLGGLVKLIQINPINWGLKLLLVFKFIKCTYFYLEFDKYFWDLFLYR